MKSSEEVMYCPAFGPLVGLKAKEKGIPYVFATAELFHATLGIATSVYLDAIDASYLRKDLNRLSHNNEYTDKNNKEGIVLADKLVTGWKEDLRGSGKIASPCYKAAKLLKEQIYSGKNASRD